jgi:hypothetical protein
VLADPDRRVALSAAARLRVGEFTIDSVAGRFADLYEELTPPRGASRATARSTAAR